jgi:hypothetical protein
VKFTALLLALSLTLLLAGCTTSKNTQPRVELTGDHLKAMALIKDELGPDYAAFELDPKSGPRTSEQLVDEASDPDDEALDVANYGILLGQEDTYFSVGALQGHSGVIFLTDGIILYADSKGAAGNLVDSIGDMQRGFSGTTKFGTLQAYQTFSPKVGEDSHGEVVRLLTPGASFGIDGTVNVTITSVEFKRDRLVGGVVIMRFDAKDVKAEVKELARKLDLRMQTVLKGEQPPTGNVSTQAP